MDKSDAEKIGYGDDIFADDAIVVAENKIANDELLDYMKKWYDNKYRVVK